MDQGQFGNLPRGPATNLLSRRQVLKSFVAGLFLPGSLGVILQSKGCGTKEDDVTNGKYLRLGKKNLADAVTALVKSGVGPVLSLLVDSGPPLKVNSQDKVDNLNSDMLDGEHASYLTRVAQIYELSVPRLPDDGSEITYGPQLTIEAPAPDFVLVNGTVTAYTVFGASKGNVVQARLLHVNSGDTCLLQEETVAAPGSRGNIALTGTFPVNGGTNRFEIRINRWSHNDTFDGDISALWGKLTAFYTPYGSTGTDTVGTATANQEPISSQRLQEMSEQK